MLSTGSGPYDNLGSKPTNPGKGSVVDTLNLPLNGITITVSPSKSAPDNLSATALLIPTASILPEVPIIFFPSCNLLFTVKVGISNVPP